MTDDKWKKVNDDSASEFWKVEKEGDEISGVYINKRENVGPNKSVVYTLKKEDGEFVNVWGTTVMDGHLSKVAVGSEIKIVYTGTLPNKQGNRTFKTFDIFVSDATPVVEPEAVTEDEVKTDDIPF